MAKQQNDSRGLAGMIIDRTRINLKLKGVSFPAYVGSTRREMIVLAPDRGLADYLIDMARHPVSTADELLQEMGLTAAETLAQKVVRQSAPRRRVCMEMAKYVPTM